MTVRLTGYRASMSHLPVNHAARPVLRVLLVGIGLFILTFGVLGLITSWGSSFFDRGEHHAFWLQTNPAFSLLSIVTGLAMIGAAIYGRNADHYLALVGGAIFLLAGVIMMAVLHTEANLLNFSLANCTTSMVIGLLLTLIGLYTKTGTEEDAEEEEKFRHGGVGREEFAERTHGLDRR
ncbi:MAG TPA: DUF4383 domain-containing protein [Natronosporangium sp.]|nr:DUF4383 domain-containing protein [Natronosporangium sp.]